MSMENNMTQPYWAEIRNYFFEDFSTTKAHQNGALLACISIDAWQAGKEEGEVIARVMLSRHGDVLTDYHDPVARVDAAAQSAIQEAEATLNEWYLNHDRTDLSEGEHQIRCYHILRDMKDTPGGIAIPKIMFDLGYATNFQWSAVQDDQTLWNMANRIYTCWRQDQLDMSLDKLTEAITDLIESGFDEFSWKEGPGDSPVHHEYFSTEQCREVLLNAPQEVLNYLISCKVSDPYGSLPVMEWDRDELEPLLQAMEQAEEKGLASDNEISDIVANDTPGPEPWKRLERKDLAMSLYNESQRIFNIDNDAFFIAKNLEYLARCAEPNEEIPLDTLYQLAERMHTDVDYFAQPFLNEERLDAVRSLLEKGMDLVAVADFDDKGDRISPEDTLDFLLKCDSDAFAYVIEEVAASNQELYAPDPADMCMVNAFIKAVKELLPEDQKPSLADRIANAKERAGATSNPDRSNTLER